MQSCKRSNCHPFHPKASFHKLKKWFQDPNKPIEGCTLTNCSECSLKTQLDCHFNLQELVLFYVIIMPVFLLGGYLLFELSLFWVFSWIAYMVLFFGFIEIRVMCSHCPHYGQKEGTTLKCWANYGAPKLWKYRPGPMNLMEKTVFIAGFIILFSFPVIAAFYTQAYYLLVLYLVLLVLWKLMLKRIYCSHCNNFACPFNSTNIKFKKQFLAQNPAIAKAWRKDHK